MLDFTERMFNNVELASLYEWNKGRRGDIRPVVELNDLSYKCMSFTLDYDYRECLGLPDLDL